MEVDADQLAISGHHIGGKERVDGEAVLADEISDPAPERDAADPDRARVAEPDGKAVRTDCVGELAGREARLCPDRAPLDVDLDALHLREVQHDPCVRRAVAGIAVAAAADGELQAGLAGQ